MTESQFRDKVKLALKKIPSCYFFKISDRFTAGLPDFLICLNGRFIGMELKVDYNKVTRLQAWVGEQIVNAGGRYLVLRWLNKKQLVEVQEGAFHKMAPLVHMDDLLAEVFTL